MDVKPALNDVFSSSPLGHIERHAQACLDCVKQLSAYFEAAQAGDWKKAEKVQAEIVRGNRGRYNNGSSNEPSSRFMDVGFAC